MLDDQLVGSALFALLFTVSLWKFKPFFSTQRLPDDDRTVEAESLLLDHVTKALSDETIGRDPSYVKIYLYIINSPDFDKKHFLRFNQNRSNRLVKMLQQRHHSDSLEELVRVFK